MTVLETVLAHHGVKGMKWGKRTKTHHADSQTALDAKKIVKKSGVGALSNKELQGLVTRVNLEQQYSNLHKKTDKKAAAAKTVADILGQVGKQQASRILSDVVTTQVKKKTGK